MVTTEEPVRKSLDVRLKLRSPFHVLHSQSHRFRLSVYRNMNRSAGDGRVGGFSGRSLLRAPLASASGDNRKPCRWRTIKALLYHPLRDAAHDGPLHGQALLCEEEAGSCLNEHDLQTQHTFSVLNAFCASFLYFWCVHQDRWHSYRASASFWLGILSKYKSYVGPGTKDMVLV